ncbi:MAG TPA: hypothetical protein VMV40_00210 [Acidiferrobacter sp.]|nr:hypothetical protein [Acidiferrobacter sp.]
MPNDLTGVNDLAGVDDGHGSADSERRATPKSVGFIESHEPNLQRGRILATDGNNMGD